MSILPSSFRESVEDRLVTHSRGAALDELAEFFLLPRPPGYSEASWRQALYSVAYGPRGNPGGIQAFLEAAMAQWNEEVEIEIRPTAKSRIYSLDHSFVQNDVGRLIRIDGVGLFLSVGPQTANEGGLSPNAGAWLDLSPMGTASWDKADFSRSAFVKTTAKILPFIICEPGPACDVDGRVYGGIPAMTQVWVYSSLLSPTPPHYIQPSSALRGDLTGSPEGGELLSGIGRSGHPVRGPWPFYITGDGLRSLRETLASLVAAGVRSRVYRARSKATWLPDRYNRRAA